MNPETSARQSSIGKSSPWRWPRIRLRLLPLLLAASAVLLFLKLGAIWNERGEAMAEPNPAAAAPPAKPGAASNDTAAGPAAGRPRTESGDDSAETAQDFSPAEVTLLQQLSKRRSELDRRAEDLDRRELLLKAVQQEVDGKIKTLQQKQAEIDQLLGKVDDQSDERLKSLVKIYETMKPQDAARIFDQMEMPVLMRLLPRMKELKTAPILASMTPDKARAVTIAMADKKPLPPDLQAGGHSN